MNKSKKLTMALGIFFTIVLILTFFSNTIYNYNLPLVTIAMPGKGKLVHKVTGNSEIEYKDSYKVYSDIEGKIHEIYVDENQSVEKGDAIVKITPTESEVDLLKQDIIKKENEISLAQLKLDRLSEEDKKYTDEMEKQKSKMNDIETKGEVKQYKDKIKNAKEEYEKIKKLYEIGAEPYSKVLAQENLIKELENDYDIFMDQEMTTSSESLSSLHLNKKDTKISIKETELNINVLKLELESLNKTMNTYKDGTIYADRSGIIHLYNLELKSTVTLSSPIGVIGVVSDDYICELRIDSKERENINQNSIVKINSTGTNSGIKGEILSIDKIEGSDMYEVRIGVLSEQEIYGQSCNITIENSSDIYDILVENSAVRKDANGYYIFVVKEEKDSLKKKYIVKRVDVTLLDRDEKYSAIDGLEFIEPVVVRSEKNIYNGNRVKYIEK
ncbi:efflux RND transporter periplasmic adaptor subunit [Paratissierella segnis]|uniref:Biotin/lipoyl-binding protein n=1 Tax=Paratissierella segnis TaxID=2763679 RepID=A0A926ILW7_9FIRM|nr:HlyD family secretion protein [Paratissierella segnis]MBC8589063.1 biotin/lipoyl-binding protein [Paratissierella segnis]